MIKMVVTDLDETLLRCDKSISKYTIEIIEKVRNTGIKVVFATARGGSTKSLIPYEIFDGYVLLNGAKAYVGNKLIYDREIPSDVYIPFLKNLSNNNLKVAAEINGTHYANFNVKNKWNYIDNFVITDYIDVSGGADKLYALIENPKQVDIITSTLPKELYLNVSRDGLAMIMHKGATKSNGILKIADEFNISKDGIIAFGDDVNDKEMFLNCGISIAMNNAIDEIKAIADYICDSNNNDGVAKWLDKSILGINIYAPGTKKV
jgi:5-amino-6-(5-phospho-D-ribitylamino)uracil phosphatase